MRPLPAAAVLIALASGCATAVIAPGHRGLVFDPSRGGLQPEMLAPGYYNLGLTGELRDYEVIWTRRDETVASTTSDGHSLAVRVQIHYRPVMYELFQLERETGPDYYRQVVAPALRLAAEAALRRYSATELAADRETVAGQIEAALRAPLARHHVEVGFVSLDPGPRPAEILREQREAVRQKLEQELEEKMREREQLDQRLQRSGDVTSGG